MTDTQNQVDGLPPLHVELTRHPNGVRLACVVYNATAGSGPGKKILEIEPIRERFFGHGWHVATIATRCAGDGTAAAVRALAEGADVVVAMGGDGTVNEVVQALAGQSVPLGIIPVGTINILARELNIPLELLDAVDAVVTGVPHVIDLGRANDRYFTAMIGLGYDAESALAMLPALKQWSGTLAYWVGAFQSFATHKSVRTKLRIEDGRKTRRMHRLIYMMVISNTGLYAGGVLKFTPEASLRDGLLDACMIRSARWYRAILHIVLTFLGRLKSVRDVEFFQAKRITITTSRPFPYQLDGDPAGHTPVTVEIVPDGLRVIAPASQYGHVILTPGSGPNNIEDGPAHE